MDSDYIAVHKEHRRKGIASQLLGEMENFIRASGGRYIHILSCDIPSYTPARAFYEKRGYSKVGEIPDYYVVGEGRVDFFKSLR